MQSNSARKVRRRANHLVRSGVQRVRRDANVRFGIGAHELERTLGGNVDAFPKLRRRVICVHPRPRKDKADAGIVGGTNRGLACAFPTPLR